MKYIILTSSIFYLLGLKFTSNIDLNSKFQVDSVQQKKEIRQIETDKEPTIDISTKKDSISAAGSDDLLAPYIVTKTN